MNFVVVHSLFMHCLGILIRIGYGFIRDRGSRSRKGKKQSPQKEKNQKISCF